MRLYIALQRVIDLLRLFFSTWNLVLNEQIIHLSLARETHYIH